MRRRRIIRSVLKEEDYTKHTEGEGCEVPEDYMECTEGGRCEVPKDNTNRTEGWSS